MDYNARLSAEVVVGRFNADYALQVEISPEFLFKARVVLDHRVQVHSLG
jgi:hypothetical protein